MEIGSGLYALQLIRPQMPIGLLITRSGAMGRVAHFQRVQVPRQFAEVSEDAGGKEVVDEGQSGLESARQRFVSLCADERVQPDEPVATSLQPRHLFAEHVRIAAVPTV